MDGSLCPAVVLGSGAYFLFLLWTPGPYCALLPLRGLTQGNDSQQLPRTACWCF